MKRDSSAVRECVFVLDGANWGCVTESSGDMGSVTSGGPKKRKEKVYIQEEETK
jgi:hypothetical protein